MKLYTERFPSRAETGNNSAPGGVDCIVVSRKSKRVKWTENFCFRLESDLGRKRFARWRQKLNWPLRFTVIGVTRTTVGALTDSRRAAESLADSDADLDYFHVDYFSSLRESASFFVVMRFERRENVVFRVQITSEGAPGIGAKIARLPF